MIGKGNYGKNVAQGFAADGGPGVCGLWRGGYQPVPVADRPGRGNEHRRLGPEPAQHHPQRHAGTIYDATGKVLAQSASVWTVVLEPAYFADYDDPEGTRQKVASGLAAILDMDEEEVYEKPRAALTLST